MEQMVIYLMHSWEIFVKLRCIIRRLFAGNVFLRCCGSISIHLYTHSRDVRLAVWPSAISRGLPRRSFARLHSADRLSLI